jgi:REP element-mobilizing transposase RayT
VTVWACSILPEHVHLVIGRHTSMVETVVSFFKGAARRQLVAEGIHPFREQQSPSGRVPHCWAKGEWKVFLDTPEDVRRAIRYVENNPLNEGKSRQRWHFVILYNP